MNFSKNINIDKNIKIGSNTPTFIIAEIGSNHNQSLKLAYKSIDAAVKAGADTVKFQYLNYDKMYLDHTKNEKFRKFFKKIELKKSWINKLLNYSNKKKILFFYSSCFKDGIDLAKELKIKLNKIASPQFCSFPQLLNYSLNSNIITIASTGYSSFKEIENTLKSLKDKKNLILLYCVSNYPTKVSDINLNDILKLKKKYNCIIGFSDHTMSTLLPSLAVMKGARVIEKHLTLNRKLKGPDHGFALEPNEFKDMVKNIREIEKIKSKKKKIPYKLKSSFEIKLVYNKNYKKNEILSNLELSGLRTNEKGIDIKNLKSLEKKYKLKFDKKKNELIKWKDLTKVY